MGYVVVLSMFVSHQYVIVLQSSFETTDVLVLDL